MKSPMTLLLSNEEIDGLLDVAMVLDAVEGSQRSMVAGKAISSPRVDTLAPSPSGEMATAYGLKAMSGLWPEADVAALRINSDVLLWPTVAGNVRRDRLPAAGGRWNGLVILFSMSTGAPLMISPDGYISRLRVGATNALAARYLAREDATVMALFGSGWHAGGQLMAHCAVRPIKTVRVFSPNPTHRERFCRELQSRVKAHLVSVDSPETAVKDADLVVTATNSMEPVHRKKWLRPGVHYSAVKVQEADGAFLEAVDRVFVFSKNPATTRPQVVKLPSVKIPDPADGWWQKVDRDPWQRFDELPHLLSGHAKGRENADQTTAFVNNVGQGLQFAAVAKRVYDEAKAREVGKEFPTEWFTQDVHP
jgi:ornithine cyclodeaminase/alanine dehydrogenase-like protein (mu-crystallin family)